MTVIIAGSQGLIGQALKEYILNEDEFEDVVELDLTLGHDLTDEAFVKEFFASPAGKAETIINLFAFNDHVRPGEKRGTLFDLPLQSFRDCMETNLTALFSVCREYSRNNLVGNIINFGASTGIVSPSPTLYGDAEGEGYRSWSAHKHAGYSVSKAGVIHLTKILAVHLAPNIRCNCVSPGGIVNDQSKEFQKQYGVYTPVGRMMYVKELFPVIRMLLNPENSYMTGANIVCDGGWSIQ